MKRTWNVLNFVLIDLYFLRFRNIQRWRNMVIDSWTYVWLKWIKTIFHVPRRYYQRKYYFEIFWSTLAFQGTKSCDSNEHYWSKILFGKEILIHFEMQSSKIRLRVIISFWSNFKINNSFLIHLCFILFDPFP